MLVVKYFRRQPVVERTVDFAKLNIQYAFAKRLGTTEARQTLCSKVMLAGPTSIEQSLCPIGPGPFDPEYGWSPTPIILNGIPVFNIQLLNSVDTTILDANDAFGGAHVTVSCKFQATYF